MKDKITFNDLNAWLKIAFVGGFVFACFMALYILIALIV